jgi:hypothetical protein
LCLGFCPRTFVRCKKRCAQKKIKRLMLESEREDDDTRSESFIR